MSVLPPTGYVLRSFEPADYDELHALWIADEGRGVGLNESDSREAIAAFLQRNPGLSLVATADGRIVAGVLCGHDGRRGYLHHLIVAERWRQQGIARALVSACLESLGRAGILKCNLFLFATNAAGRAFWKRLGWTVRDDLNLLQIATSESAASCAQRSC